MNADRTSGDRAMAESGMPFPLWLSEQVCRPDEIGHWARLAVETGDIDRSDQDLIGRAIIEWAQS